VSRSISGGAPTRTGTAPTVRARDVAGAEARDVEVAAGERNLATVGVAGQRQVGAAGDGLMPTLRLVAEAESE
jgi:hypothetical protein